MVRSVRGLMVVAVLVLVVAVPLLYSSHLQTTVRNFRVVEDGVLYRSGQLSPEAFERVLNEYQIKTVITLRTVRDPKRPYPDEWERTICDARGLKHLRLVPRLWGEDEKGEVPADVNVQAFLEVMEDRANHPVLIHCFAGIHRTGTMCAIFRMEFHGWSADGAIAEMQACGFDPDDLHEHIEGYLRSDLPRWKQFRKKP